MQGKVCIITTAHSALSVRINLKQAKTLIQAGYDVTLIAQHDKDEVVEGIKIINLPKSRNRFTRILTLTMQAFWLARKQGADIYHFHDPEFLFWGWMLQKVSGKSVIYDIHEYYADSILEKDWLPTFLRKITAKLFDKIEKGLSSRLSGIVTVNEDLGEKFRDYNRNVIVLPNYPLRELFDGVSLNRDLRQKYKNNKTIVYVGGLSKARGITRSIKIIPLLKRAVPNVKILILGSFANRDYKKNIMNLIDKLGVAESVEFMGKVPHERVPQYLKVAQVGIFLLQPVSERYNKGEPIKYFEYSAAGLPVIISDLPAKRRLIKENENGLLVDPLDEEDIAEKIIYLLKNKDVSKEMGANGRKAFLEKYNWEAIEDRLVNFYKEIGRK